jgi:hypothetical protein
MNDFECVSSPSSARHADNGLYGDVTNTCAFRYCLRRSEYHCFLARRVVSPVKLQLQLVGVTVMHIAANDK